MHLRILATHMLSDNIDDVNVITSTCAIHGTISVYYLDLSVASKQKKFDRI